MRQPGRHLSYANVMVTVAVFLALGGGAYAFDASGGEGPAARTITVSKSALKQMIRQEAAAQVNAAAKKKKKARRGPQGATGPQGPNGVQGSPGVSGLQQVFKSSAVDTSNPKSATVTCPPGKRAIGGGATHSNASPGSVGIDQIQPTDQNTVPGGTTVSATATGAVPSWSVTAFVLCANVS